MVIGRINTGNGKTWSWLVCEKTRLLPTSSCPIWGGCTRFNSFTSWLCMVIPQICARYIRDHFITRLSHYFQAASQFQIASNLCRESRKSPVWLCLVLLRWAYSICQADGPEMIIHNFPLSHLSAPLKLFQFVDVCSFCASVSGCTVLRQEFKTHHWGEEKVPNHFEKLYIVIMFLVQCRLFVGRHPVILFIGVNLITQPFSLFFSAIWCNVICANNEQHWSKLQNVC